MQKENLVSIFKSFINEIEPDSTRSGLTDTPERAAKAWIQSWASGYNTNIPSLFKTFEDGGDYTGIVLVRDINVYSHCEHHLAPIIGKAVVAYKPNGKIVGLSKINRLVDAFARRLQVQERMTDQIADSLYQNLDPSAVGVWIKARHLCMESRGISQCSLTETISLRGYWQLDKDKACLERDIFLKACK